MHQARDNNFLSLQCNLFIDRVVSSSTHQFVARSQLNRHSFQSHAHLK
jgi:hypothetical protein